MHRIPQNDLSRNHIFLSPNGDYSRHLVKLCERCVQHEKKVLLLTQRKMSSILEKPRSLHQLEHWLHIAFKDIESAPRRIIELYDCAPHPDLIVFDMHSIIAELICRPVLQQCSRETLVRLIAKCAAAFCNYREMVHVSKLELARSTGKEHPVDTIVIMPTEAYPLSPEQFKLLIGLYFYGNELYNNFSQLSERIRVSQGLH
ncbi:uncharacterized protein LOC117789209 [Drosophila innubila]|uniref:uncharacterized protein LOC117789209 n=1 Tax=Drosophila innubila TaxID=198719 RepID=UPI00148B9CD3|nr:uncharacterized protein LOC117789209 [Drosophila innubila]